MIYNSRGNVYVTTESGTGLYSAGGKFRITITTGSSWTGLYAPDGSFYAVIVLSSDTPYGLYHASGALRVVESSTQTGMYAPNGALYVEGASWAAAILLPYGDGLSIASRDNTMQIVSTSDPTDSYLGTPGAKLTTTRASSATYWDINGVLQSAGNNVLRRDYDPRLSSTTERCGYLIEEARTNLTIRSEEFTNAIWVEAGAATTVTDDVVVGPDGLTSMALIADNNTISGNYGRRQSVNISASTQYTFSIFIKKKDWRYVQINGQTNVAGAHLAYFDLDTGTVSGASAATGTMTNVGGGIWRATLTFTTGGTDASVLCYVLPTDTTSTSAHTGVVGNGTYFYGSQLEAGSFASSYIPTTTATVTRAADLVTLAGTLFPLNQSEGTLYAKWVRMSNSVVGYAVHLDDGTTNERSGIYGDTTGKVGFFIADGGVAQLGASGLLSTGTIAPLVQARASAGYKLNDSAAANIGETVQTDNVCTMPTPTQLVLGNRAGGATPLNGWLFEAMYLPERLTNSELQNLASG